MRRTRTGRRQFKVRGECRLEHEVAASRSRQVAKGGRLPVGNDAIRRRRWESSLSRRCQVGLVLPGIVVIMSGFVECTRRPSGEMDEWFKSHAWKACVGS